MTRKKLHVCQCCLILPPGRCVPLSCDASVRVPRVKIASKGNLSPKTKPQLLLGASQTSLTRVNASSRKSHQPRERGTPGQTHGAWKVMPETHRAKRHAQPSPGRPMAHLRHRSRQSHQRARSRRPGHPRATPWSTPARGERPDRSGIGHSRVEQSAEKRRGKTQEGRG